VESPSEVEVDLRLNRLCSAIAHAMKNRRKLLVVMVVILAIAAAGIVHTFNVLAGKYREQVQQELQKVLGKDVAFASLEVTLFGGPGFVAKEFRIADDPRFAATPLLRAKELVLGVSLWNLFFQQLVITTLAFKEPEFQIITDESGRRNLTTLLHRKGELRQFPALRPAAPERKRAAVSFLIRKIRIKDGRLDYVDRSVIEPAELRVGHISMTLTGFDRREPVTLHFSASLTEGLSQELRIDGRLNPASQEIPWTQRPMDLDLQVDSLQVPMVARAIAALRDKIPSELDVTGSMALKAKVAGTPARPRIDDITLKVPLFGSSDYNAVINGSVEFSERRSWDDAQMRGKAVVTSLALARLRALKSLDQILPSALAADGTVGIYARFEGTRDNLRIGALVRADQADLRYKESLHKRAGSPMDIKARITRQKQRLVFHDSEVVVGANTMKFSGLVDYQNPARLELKLAGKQLPASAWSGLFGSWAFVVTAGKADWDIAIEKSLLRADDDWGAQGRVKLSGADIRSKESGAKIENVNGEVFFTGEQARFDEISFRIGRSTILLAGAAANLSEPIVNYTLRSPALYLPDLPSLATMPPVQLKNMNANGELQFRNERFVLTGSVRAPQASLYDMDIGNLRADVALTAAGLTFKNLSAQVLSGSLHSDGYWGSSAGHSQQIEFSSKVDALDMRALIARLLPLLNGKLEGRLNGHARFDAATVDGGSIKDALKGSGEASVQEGIIKDFNLVSQLLFRGSGAVGSSARLPAGLAGLIDRPDTTIDSLKADFTVEQNRVSTENLVITTPDYTITGAGWIGFDRSIKWNGLLLLSPRLTQVFQHDYRIIRYLLDRRGRLATSFRLDGKIPNIRIRLDNRALAQALRAGFSGRGDDQDADTKPNQETKDVKRWIPDAIERFLNR
jgi:uncharacterized protein involved in outer membrane biogenesis